VRNDLGQRMHEWFARHAAPEFDLWSGGGSQSHIATAKQIAAGIAERNAAKPTTP
jgi:hypothetical protein